MFEANGEQMFTALCRIPSEMRSIDRAISRSVDPRVKIANPAAARKVRDAICNAFLKRKKAKRLDLEDADSLSEIVYEAGRDGAVEAISQHLGPGRITGPDRVELARVVDEMRTNLPYESITDGETTILPFETYYSRIVTGSLKYTLSLHRIIRISASSADYTEAGLALSVIVGVALAPFATVVYLAKCAAVTELTFTVQMYMKVLHRHGIAALLGHMMTNPTLFNRKYRPDRQLIVAMTTISTDIRESAMQRLSETEVTQQMGVVMRTSRNAKQAYEELAESHASMSSKVGRVRDFKYRERVELAEVTHEKQVVYAWVFACVAFLIAGISLLLTEKYIYVFGLIAVAVSVVAMSFFASLIKNWMR